RSLAKRRDQAREVSQRFASGWSQRFLKVFTRGSLGQRHAGFAGPCGQRIDGSVSNAALRNRYSPPECFLVRRIRDQLEIGHQIANLPTIVEAHRPDQPVWNGLATERVLERAALRVRPVEHREFVEAPIVARLPRLYFLEYEVRLVPLVERRDEGHRFAGIARRPQCLPFAPDVLGNGGICYAQNVRRRAIVLFKPDQPGRSELLLEVEDIPDVRAAPPVDRLIVVTDNDDVTVTAAEELDELELGAVGVLILVDENELKPVAIASEGLLVAAEYLDRQDEQVVEAHRVGRSEGGVQRFIDFGCRPRNRI